VNQRVRYELRGWAYWLECANPFRETVAARRLPLGLRIEGYKRDVVGRGLYRRGVHEPGLTRFLLERFSSAGGSSFLDVGANLGYFSCLLGKLAGPRGKVVAIEPEPNNFKLLQRNLRNNGLKNVTVHECAVGGWRRKDGDLPVRRLDDLVKDAGVESWDLVKMDVEGYEAFVFEGAKETLARAKMLGDGVRADSLEESRD